MAICQIEQVVRASWPERESWGDLWEKWDLVLGLQRSRTWRGKEKGGEAGSQQIWNLSSGFTNKWFSDLRQVIFLRFNFLSLQNGHDIISPDGSPESRLRDGDYCAESLWGSVLVSNTWGKEVEGSRLDTGTCQVVILSVWRPQSTPQRALKLGWPCRTVLSWEGARPL